MPLRHRLLPFSPRSIPRQPRVSFFTLYYVAAADRLPCLSRASRGASKGGGRPSRGTAISGCAPLSVGLEPREGVRLLLRPWAVGASSSPCVFEGLPTKDPASMGLSLSSCNAAPLKKAWL